VYQLYQEGEASADFALEYMMLMVSFGEAMLVVMMQE
jgi:hypothetical protein